MQTKIIYLKPKATFRAELRSDTLWGHICWAIRNIYGEQKLESFIQETPFIVSSTFPYLEVDGKKLEFFPRPTHYETTKPIDQELSFEAKLVEMNKQKKAKKTSNWFSKTQFEQFINGEEVEQNNQYPPTQKSFSVTRNRIDRMKGGTIKVNGAGQLFHIDEIYFDQETAGLFFLAKGKEFTLLEGALRYLSHIGLGGDRSTGKGNFEISEPQHFDLKEPQNTNSQINLSLYHPTDSELAILEKQITHYHLEDRQGRLGFVNHKHVYKKAFLFFKEGSQLPIFDKKLDIGKNLIAKKLSHNVYHYGKGFMIKTKTTKPQ